MENPDTVVELHRERVEAEAAKTYQGESYDRPYSGDYTEQGTATLNIALGRVWFVFDSHGRLWQEEAAGQPGDPKRHFALDLVLTDSQVAIQSIAGVPLVPLPPRTVTIPDGPRAGESRQIAYNTLPLFGRLTLNEQVSRRVLPSGNETISIDFNPEDAPLLVAKPPPDQFVSHLFGTGIERRPDGSTAFGGQDPRVVWDMDYAEAFWITHSPVGELLVAREKVLRPTASDAEARRSVLDSIAATIGTEVQGVVKGLGVMGVVDLLPQKEGLEVDPTAEDGLRELDVIVQRFQAGGATHESLVIQLRTLDPLPPGEELPASILAAEPTERAALATAGFALLRGVRSSVIRSLCLDPGDFDGDAPCLLDGAKSVEVGGESRTLETFEARIEPGTDTTRGRLVVDGRISGGEWWMYFGATFRITYEMDLDDIPREVEPADKELPISTGQTKQELDEGLREKAVQKCAGAITADAYETAANRVKDLFKELPRTIGVAPTLRPPKPSVDANFGLTLLGEAAVAVGVAIIPAIPITLGAVFAGGLSIPVLMGLIVAWHVAWFVLVIDLYLLGPGIVRGQVQNALGDRPGGSLLPTLGVPIDIQLRRDLAVYFRATPPRLDVSCIKKDTTEDLDEVIQIVGGSWPTDGKQWKISDNDAVVMLDKGQLELFIDAAAAGGTAQRIHVATSSNGRRYLRTDPDEAVADNLASLPECPVTPEL